MMTCLRAARTFRSDEDGAITVDWVVLTAAIVGLAIAVVAGVRTGIAVPVQAMSQGAAYLSITTTF